MRWNYSYVQKDEMNIKLKDFPLYILGFFVLGLLLGGIYSLPAMLVTKDKEPWLTILLALGLSISVATVGALFFQSNTHIIYAVISANILLFIRRAFGKLDHNVERFGMVHAVSLMGCSCLALLT